MLQWLRRLLALRQARAQTEPHAAHDKDDVAALFDACIDEHSPRGRRLRQLSRFSTEQLISEIMDRHDTVVIARVGKDGADMDYSGDDAQALGLAMMAVDTLRIG